ncbi:MAG: hypothetical protein GWN01_10090 [Nitrosopumilaceae archaeon]|nr:hypothetical protein [Nitrosopumilaceae archaeon]NIU87600.1 hypothetical protein [Nitrosopumilaceae archaeon]NIV64798.1 hypothetical protein [Nitrosopumilaceae archaeon]NIX61853.1 hypothetical protein [Nitrosopumilaceae archaeon]
MNLQLTKDEFHETMMLYFLEIAQENKAVLKEGKTIVYSVEFDEFLRHIIERPLGSLRTAYYREDGKTKLSFKRLNMNIKERDRVRIMV